MGPRLRPPGPGHLPLLIAIASVPLPVMNIRGVHIGVSEALVCLHVHLRLLAHGMFMPVVKIVPVPVGVRCPLMEMLVRMLLAGDQERPGSHQGQGRDELPARNRRRDHEGDTGSDEWSGADDSGCSRRPERAKGEDEADHARPLIDCTEQHRRERDLEQRERLSEGGREREQAGPSPFMVPIANGSVDEIRREQLLSNPRGRRPRPRRARRGRVRGGREGRRRGSSRRP